MTKSSIERCIQDYKDSLCRMSENRLRVEYNFLLTHPNRYSGKPLKFKLDAVMNELRFKAKDSK